MNDLRSIGKLKTDTLHIVQPKWYKAKYELTDDAFTYARIYTEGFWHLTTVFETAVDVLRIRNTSTGGLEIKDGAGNILGKIDKKVLKGTTSFTLNNGQTFTHRMPSMWKSEYIWEDEYTNELMKITFGAFSGKTSISFIKKATDIPYLFVLIFIAFKLKMDSTAHG